MSQQDARQLRILSLNCWGLKFVSKFRHQRIRAIADFVCAASASEYGASPSSSLDSDSTPLTRKSQASGGSRYDVVCLQEVWCSEDWEYIERHARESGSGLTHGRYFWSGALGSGCCILSKYPIVSTLTRPYTLCGSPLHFIEGDWYVAKACGQAVLDLGPELGYATVLNTHMAAFGGPEWSEHWKTSHRLSQAWELARLVSEAADRGHQVFVCGDLNSRPTSLVIQLLLSQGELSDSWVAAHPPEASSAPSNPITAQDAITYHGITCDNPINSFSAAKRFDEQVTRAQGKRLDYILYRSPTSHIDSVQKPIPPKRLHHLTCVASHVTATELVPGASYSLSDHFGIESTFQLTPLPSDTEPGAYVAPIPARPPAPEHMRVTIEALIQYSTHVERLSRRQLGIFAACLALIPGISVAASFQPIKWLNWVFVILGIANGALGATMLYTGFVGGRWEMSALKNAIKDMTLELERYERRGQR